MKYYPFSLEDKKKAIVRLTSRFGIRKHPIAGKVSYHNGCDYAPVRADKRVYIIASANGVLKTGTDKYGGLWSQITGDDGYKYLTVHHYKFIKRSGYVKAGEKIAIMGNSGNSTGKHVHFTVKNKYGVPVDPEKQNLSYFIEQGYEMIGLKPFLAKTINTKPINVFAEPTSKSKIIGQVQPERRFKTKKVANGENFEGKYPVWYSWGDGWISGKYVKERGCDNTELEQLKTELEMCRGTNAEYIKMVTDYEDRLFKINRLSSK